MMLPTKARPADTSLPKVILTEERRYYFRCPVCAGSTKLPITMDLARPVHCRSCRKEYRVGRVNAWDDRE